jgi:hypothetical protein
MQRANDIRKEQIPQFGKPYQGTRKHSKFHVLGEDLTVIPVEIEIDSYTFDVAQGLILILFPRFKLKLTVPYST